MMPSSVDSAPLPAQVQALALNAVRSLALHPLLFSRTLMQLGFEPEPPKLQRTLGALLLGGSQSVPMYPGLLTYLRRLRERTGWFGLFTVGLPARLVSSSVAAVVAQRTRHWLDPEDEALRAERQRRRKLGAETGAEFALATGCAAVSHATGVLVVYPLTVVMVRQMALVGGGDQVYVSIGGAVAEIWRTEGVSGFFSGALPAVFAELLSVAVSASLAYVVNRWVLKDTLGAEAKEMTHLVTGMMAGQLVYRYHVLATVLAVDGARNLDLAMNFGATSVAYRYLAERALLSRGGAMAFRRAPACAVPVYQ